MNYNIVDEIMLLARQVMGAAGKKGEDVSIAEQECEKADILVRQGREVEAVKHAVKAYETLYY